MPYKSFFRNALQSILLQCLAKHFFAMPCKALFCNALQSILLQRQFSRSKESL
jgi:hypothetical protein